MDVATDGGQRRRRRWAELRGAEQSAIVLSIISAAVAIPYAVVIGLFLASEPSCETSWTVGPATTLAYLGVLAVTGGTVAGVWASLHRPRLIGLAAIAFNLGLLVVGLVLLAYDFSHASPFSCLGG